LATTRAPAAALREGLVVASHGRHVWVETPQGERWMCHARGKKSQTVVGDRVLWMPSSDEGTIERVLERRNLLYRQDEIRTKSFAANLDLVLILIAAEPEFSESQLTRALIAAAAQDIAVLVVLNKSDLQPHFSRAWERLAPYRAMGYTVLGTALRAKPGPTAVPPDSPPDGWPALLEALAHTTSLVLGPSGAGKSTLINRLVPGAQALTQEISSALNSGKHTTTSTTHYWTDAARRTALIDSPGFQEFGLQHIDPMRLASLMPDLCAWVDQCKFYNCSHLHEPGCGVMARVATQGDAHSEGAISPSRYRIYQELFAELSQQRY
jgi:ribosome biogenesis GTPase